MSITYVTIGPNRYACHRTIDPRGPRVIEDNRLRNGRPTTEWEAMWLLDGTLDAPHTAVPDTSAGRGLCATPRRFVDTQQREKAGRPLLFSYDDACRIKRRYWDGEETIKSLAINHKTTAVTISRLVHGLTYWWIP